MAERLRDTNAKLVQQNLALAEIEEATHMTVKNISYHVPDDKQDAFKRELVPLLDRLKDTLEKYSDS
jgi:hypothetical protein